MDKSVDLQETDNNAEHGDVSHGEAYEAEHVHAVYEQIATHFSSTRYKPWPIITAFLLSLAPGSIGLDIGCGNGKYLALLPANRSVFVLASDRSPTLAGIAAQHQPHSAMIADNLALPHPAGCFDFAISVAVVHHLSTRERRVRALKAVLEVLRPLAIGDSGEGKAEGEGHVAKGEGGKALIYVWALEQKGSRRGWDEGDEQDVMVPWVMKGKSTTSRQKQQKHRNTENDSKSTEAGGDQTFHRYYHLYRNGELEADIEAAGGVVLESGYEKDNWWAIAGRNPP
ncbi:S-adenosyl-L-methionine-dependent methyltransferase [Cryomyces antarcticus]